MLVYFSFVIPIIISLILFIFFRHKIQWWEIAVPMVISVLLVLLAKWICVSSLTSDTEWLGGYVTEVRYYEPWDEEVSCRHPKYCDEYDRCCSRDSKGNCNSCTRRVQCGYKHLYDVDYHSEYWLAKTTLSDYSISENRYYQLVKQFGTGKNFVDMHRDYHSIDGDMYSTVFDNDDSKLEPVAESHTYENRPMVSNSIYKYEEIDSFDIKTYKPFDYPSITNDFHQKVLLGHNDKKIEQRLQVLNSRFGAPKQIRIFFLVFKNQPREAGLIQERYWQGGNKNELIICVGTDAIGNVNWGHVISWTDETAVKIKIKHQIENNKNLDINHILDTVEEEIKTDWKRKPFHDFDYLNIEPTTTQVIWILILTLIVNIGLAYWIVINEFEVDNNGKSYNKY